jgi:aldehyde:ferredoxin oxidoreductase
MDYKGYTGTILSIDLSDRTIEPIPFPVQLAEKYIGGVGIAAKLIYDRVRAELDPFDPHNPLIFMTGPLTGTIIPWSGRHCVASISPLTGIWGEAYAGGTWGKELKKAGFDGLVISGKADRLVYLKIVDQAVTLEDAAFLKGKDTFETEHVLQRIIDSKPKVAAIGVAGENCVRFASVMHDGPAARAAARCGFGAVMGSKNLKAIAVSGSRTVEIANREKLVHSIRATMPELIKQPEHCLGKANAVFSMFLTDGRAGVHNWRDSELAGFNEAVLKEIESHIWESQPYQCAGCPTGCVESNVKEGTRQTVWEVMAPLGSQCGITDMHFIQKVYDICNRHGIDTISAGGVMSFAMECFEAGLITEKDTDNMKLVFGNGDVLLAMLEKICLKEGFGAVLAEGALKAARIVGKGADKFAIEVKALEVPAHDPRAHNFLALAYATDPRGAIHTGAADPKVEGFDLMDMAKIRFAAGVAPEMVARGQDYACILNSLVLCAFSHAGYAQYYSANSFPGLTAKEVTAWFNLATGMEQDFSSLMKAGERIFNLKHAINLNRGLDAASDCLHERFITTKKNYGPAANHLPQVQEMVQKYYKIRGWHADGKIDPNKLCALGIC